MVNASRRDEDSGCHPQLCFVFQKFKTFSRSKPALTFSVVEIFLSHHFKLGFTVKPEQVQNGWMHAFWEKEINLEANHHRHRKKTRIQSLAVVV
jgi:hypothetical protein